MQLKYCVFTINLFINLVPVFNFKFETKHSVVYEDVTASPSRATYFGYSVAIHTGKEHWIQIGAPRANSSHNRGVMEPGILYQCQIGEICNEVNLSVNDNESNNQKESKTNAWIGVSITPMSGIKGDNVVVCGHRWKDIRYSNSYMMPGACYVVPIGSEGIPGKCKLIPLSVADYFIKNLFTGQRSLRIYGTGVGQAGISSHCSKKTGSHELVLGAPGILNWQGATVTYKIPENQQCGMYESHRNNAGLNHEPLYFGYAVSSGHLFPNKGLVHVASAPRAFGGRGMVLLYEYGVNNGITPIIEIAGTQLGEYFGASIATADVNQDGYDDLIIGAPRHSTASTPDHGRIYISLGGERITGEMEHIDGLVKNSQFGATVAAIGDINNDGFPDIAVGAPYSNDNEGSVHIYVGGKNGLLLTQIIHASQISLSLKGFGISIHHTAETCKREKSYMAIGAYLSGHVAVLRSYPAINLSIQLNSSIKIVGKSDQQFSLTACSLYHAACGPPEISITRIILLDPEYSRIHLQKANRKEFSHKEDIILQEGQVSCHTLSVIIHEDIENRDYSIVIEASQSLNNDEQMQNIVLIKTNGTKTGYDTFCRNCSVINQESSKLSDTLKLPFADCGADEICNSELHLLCSFPEIVNGSFVIGSRGELKLLFIFMNKKEAAYQTVLHVQIPEPAKNLRQTRNCQETPYLTETILHCNLNSPLDYNDKDKFLVEIDVSGLAEEDLTSITFSAWLSTTSLDSGAFNNCTLDLELKYNASMRMIGKSTKEVVSYASGTEAEFVQTYQVYKSGESPVRKAETIINVPYSLRISESDTKQFLSITQFQVTQGSYHIQCESDWPLPISSSNAIMPNIQQLDGLQTELARAKRDLMKRVKRAEVQQDISTSPSDKILYLNCTNKDVFCQTITCTSAFADSKALLNIRFAGIVNTSKLGDVMKMKNTIVLSTDGKVIVKEPERLIPYDKERMDTSLATISFVLEVPEQRVEIWVIAVSVICGILVLLIIAFVLRKVGFFKREKREALQKLVASTVADEFYYQKQEDPIPAEQVKEGAVSPGETCVPE